jgi:hypothetical protein
MKIVENYTLEYNKNLFTLNIVLDLQIWSGEVFLLVSEQPYLK